jgi:DNA end-binding protein Ku
VVVTDDEIEELKTERDKTISILHFTEQGSIPSVYFDKSYLVAPDGGDKAYELLRRAMLESGVIGVARSVLWSKESMMALIPEENGIRLQTLFYMSQIKTLPMPARRAEVADTELNMGKLLVQSMIQPYQPELYRDEYETRLMEAIQRKVEGREFVDTMPQQSAGNVIDLMEALERSLAQRQMVPPVQRQPVLSGVQ